MSYTEASVKKWDGISDALHYIGGLMGEHCGLCIKYKIGGGYCHGCPVHDSDSNASCGDLYSSACETIDKLTAKVDAFQQQLVDVMEKEAREELAAAETEKAKVAEFKPVTLTMETEEEADLLWHLLNNSEGQKFNDYIENRPPLAKNVGDTLMHLWQRHNREVYCPQR